MTRRLAARRERHEAGEPGGDHIVGLRRRRLRDAHRDRRHDHGSENLATPGQTQVAAITVDATMLRHIAENWTKLAQRSESVSSPRWVMTHPVNGGMKFCRAIDVGYGPTSPCAIQCAVRAM